MRNHLKHSSHNLSMLLTSSIRAQVVLVVLTISPMYKPRTTSLLHTEWCGSLRLISNTLLSHSFLRTWTWWTSEHMLNQECSKLLRLQQLCLSTLSWASKIKCLNSVATHLLTNLKCLLLIPCSRLKRRASHPDPRNLNRCKAVSKTLPTWCINGETYKWMLFQDQWCNHSILNKWWCPSPKKQPPPCSNNKESQTTKAIMIRQATSNSNN